MPLALLLGGARSGKSDLAVRLATGQPNPVVMIATAEAGDDEMAARIAVHRAQRPAAWTTIEEPLRLLSALERAPAESCVLIDCLTLWTSNMLAAHGAQETERQAKMAAAAAAGRHGTVIAVSNEVGLGLVPDNPLGRAYRDLLGRVNTIWAGAAAAAYLVVAGCALELAGEASILDAIATITP